MLKVGPVVGRQLENRQVGGSGAFTENWPLGVNICWALLHINLRLANV